MEQKLYSKRLYCESCDIKFANRTLLSEHNNVVHADRPFECVVCHKKFADRFGLKVHFRVHTGEKPYVCSYCKKAFAQACNLTTHKKRYHFKKFPSNQISVMQKSFLKGVRSYEVKRFPCPHCKIYFRRIEHVKAHIMSQHVSRTVNGGSNSRSPSTSSGISSSSSNSDAMQQMVQIKQEPQIPKVPFMTLHCKRCKLTFPERVSYQKHMYAHAKQQEAAQGPNSAIQVSTSSGQKVNLRELVSQIKTIKEEPDMPSMQKDVMQKLTGLGMEISLHPLRKSASGNELGLVISSVQSVSQRFFDELESPKQPLRANIGPRRVIKQESILSQTNTTNGTNRLITPKIESQDPDEMGDRDPLELPPPPTAISSVRTSHTNVTPPPLKKPKIEPDDEVILSSTRRTSRAACTYNEADQPKHISIITKQRNGKTTKRRIFPCGQCTSKFENIETRKMHFLTVHGSAAKSRKENKTPPPHVNEPPIIPHMIPAYEEDNDE